MAVRWKTVAFYAGVLVGSAALGAGGVYLTLNSSLGDRWKPSAAVHGTAAAAASSPAAAGATSIPPGDAVPHESDPPVPASNVTPSTAVPSDSSVSSPFTPADGQAPGAASSTDGINPGLRSGGDVDVPRMAQDLGPFSPRLRSIACQPRHSTSADNDRPRWVCSVTLATVAMPYPVALDGPHDRLAIYTEPLFASSYAFVYVPAHDDKAAHFSAAIDPKAAPYSATMAWTGQVINQALAQALQAEQHTVTSTPYPRTVEQRNSDSWAAVGVR